MTRPADVLIGAKLRKARTRKGLRPRDIAATLGLHPVLIGAWERGQEPVPPARREALAAALGLSAADLLPPRVEVLSSEKAAVIDAMRARQPETFSHA